MTTPDAATEALAERIVGPALLLDNGLIVSRPAPDRHHHLLRLIYQAGISDPGGEAQGFITSKGRFVGRHTGLHIANIAKQIVTKHGSPTMLFSEDMW